ncbi:hypothetical protein FJ976_02860 [Mesorhizobium sp. B1-1-9]|uniref:hypothetical protein n=1 Tax=Mesorhizobium sp. B1-1-9 TaxID=2589975 RepID=UPI001127AE79|nr:hypothetical protein [Mesorhizobium sp. B1-1-9]TPN57595.1 hypothetical protein FJ976_02860 [Mesorhizobium sp. B1-1-9]
MMTMLPLNTCTPTDHLHLDPEFLARASFFLTYAADRRPAIQVLSERFNIERKVALSVLRELGWKDAGGANARP